MDVENSKINFINIILILRITSLCWWRKNIIILLLRLEFILISLFFLISLSIITSLYTSILIILIIIVRGSRLGLRLLVTISKSHNSSNSYYINLLTFDKNNFTKIFIIFIP